MTDMAKKSQQIDDCDLPSVNQAVVTVAREAVVDNYDLPSVNPKVEVKSVAVSEAIPVAASLTSRSTIMSKAKTIGAATGTTAFELNYAIDRYLINEEADEFVYRLTCLKSDASGRDAENIAAILDVFKR